MSPAYHMSFCRIYGRCISTQKQSKISLPKASKYRTKRDPSNSKGHVQSTRVLWEPFREVLPDHEHEVGTESKVVEDRSHDDGLGAAARFWGISPSEAHERAADAVTPLWRLDYGRQLEVKQARVRALLRQLGGRLTQGGHTAAPGRRRPGLPCKLDRIVPSPQIEQYRNKEEYKIGEGVDGHPRTVGFLFSSPTRGPPLCLPGDRLRNCKPQHARTALAFQQFVRDSPLPVCSRLDDGGHWRTLLVRSSRHGQLLASVTLHPQQLAPERIQAERDRLREFFRSGPGAECRLDALLFQECRHTRCSADQAPFQSLFGPAALEDRLGHLRLLVSPSSFLQVNLPAAEELYRVVEERLQLTQNSVLLDLCSGTGPVGLLMARRCRLCIGIEAAASSVQDANENARINKIQNVEFINGRVEQELPRLVADLELCSDMVAVVNPGRDGVAPRVIDQLRASPRLRRLVYIACKPDHPRTSANLTALCRPAADDEAGRPFRLARASPVDLFPHTDHLELVLTFER